MYSFYEKNVAGKGGSNKCENVTETRETVRRPR